jgi:hypothetical protein
MKAGRRFDPVWHGRGAPNGERPAHAITLGPNTPRAVNAALCIKPAHRCFGVAHDRFCIELSAPRPDFLKAVRLNEICKISELVFGNIAVIGVHNENRIALARKPLRHFNLALPDRGNIGPKDHTGVLAGFWGNKYAIDDTIAGLN